MQAEIGEAAESSTTDLQAAGEERYWAWFGLLKTQNHHQWQTSSNKATFPNPSQYVSLSDEQAFKYMS